MIPTIYEMQDACVLADAGTVFPVSLGMEHPAQIILMNGVNVQSHDSVRSNEHQKPYFREIASPEFLTNISELKCTKVGDPEPMLHE